MYVCILVKNSVCVCVCVCVGGWVGVCVCVCVYVCVRVGVGVCVGGCGCGCVVITILIHSSLLTYQANKQDCEGACSRQKIEHLLGIEALSKFFASRVPPIQRTTCMNYCINKYQSCQIVIIMIHMYAYQYCTYIYIYIK
jgi:hypothetical protein